MVFVFKYWAVTVLTVSALNILSVVAQDSEILYNLAKIGSASDQISSSCRNDLERVFNSINDRDIWAMKVLDASGKFGSGFVWGNNFLLGDQTGCNIVNQPIYLTQTRYLNPLNPPNFVGERSPFPVQYRMVYIRHASRLQYDATIYDRKILHLGLCFPKSCHDNDAMELARTYFNKNEFVGYQLTGNITVMRTQTLELRPNFWSLPFVQLFIWITAFNIINILVGTVYTYKAQQKRLKQEKKDDDPIPVKSSLVARWLHCFSLIENTKSIFTYNIGDDAIKIVHGFRVIGMFWLVIGHIIFYALNTMDNLEISMKIGDIWYLQPIATDFLGVDTFTVFGAFLLSFLFFERLKRMDKVNGIVLLVKTIVSRYIRLTPLYFIAILMTYIASVYLEDTTPYALFDDYEKNCKERYFLNLLYLNNLIPMKDSCMNWAWYVANDFQLFVIALIVLVVFIRNKKFGIFLGTALSLISIGMNMYFALKVKFSFAFDNYFNTVDVMYTPTWNRVATYFVAIVAGSYFSKVNRQLRLSKNSIVLYWIMAIVIILGQVFLHIFKDYNTILAVGYSGFGRILWGSAICWILMACASNNGGFLTKLFEYKFWIPLSRMSYACYLTNPIVILLTCMMTEVPFHFNLLFYIINSLGFIVLCFLVSYIMMIVYENPFNMLIRTFIMTK